jgi:tRNA pseudouridine55 synthase
MDGILLVDKPTGWTSNDVARKVRFILKANKVGHAGTLDPKATGLIILCINGATKMLANLMGCEKEYEVTAKFGATTSTYDTEGEVVKVRDVPENLLSLLECVREKFSGEILQRPPDYSAVKVNGRPLYQYARKGLVVPEVNARKVEVKKLDILTSDGDEVSFRVVCSAGTYIRSIIHDMGEAVGCGAHVTRLSRTRCGEWSVDKALKLQEICSEGFLERAHLHVISRF